MKEMPKGPDDRPRQEDLEEMFERVFMKASIVQSGESVFQAERPAQEISQLLEDYKWENYWIVDRCGWMREQERGMETG